MKQQAGEALELMPLLSLIPIPRTMVNILLAVTGDKGFHSCSMCLGVSEQLLASTLDYGNYRIAFTCADFNQGVGNCVTNYYWGNNNSQQKKSKFF